MVSVFVGRIMFFLVISCVNFAVLMFMLAFEFRRLGCHWSSLKDKKVIIFIILAFMQFCKCPTLATPRSSSD